MIIWFLLLFGLIYIFATWKITLYNTMFGQGYWLKLITWTFGAGKTKNVYQSAFLWKQENPHWLIISNLNYSFVDIYFDDKTDFGFLMEYLVKYIQETNDPVALKKNFDFPPIKVIVDEAHLYLFSRDFKTFWSDQLLVLTQCRKRSISIDFITQELWQIDVFIRRLITYVHHFTPVFKSWTSQSMLYVRDNTSTDINDPIAFEEIEQSFLVPHSWTLKLRPKLQEFYDQHRMTKWVVGAKSVFDRDYHKFKQILWSKVEAYRKPPIKEIKSNLFNKFLFSKLRWKNEATTDQEIIKKQSEIIKEIFKLLTNEQISKLEEKFKLGQFKQLTEAEEEIEVHT